MNLAHPVSLGSERARCLERAGLSVTEARFAPSTSLPKHVHTDASVAVVLQGGFELTVGGRDRDCPAGSVMIEPPAEPHSNRFAMAGTRVLVVQVDSTRSGELESFGVRLDKASQCRDQTVAFLAWRLVGELDAKDDFTALAVEGLALELLVAVSRSSPPAGRARPSWLAAVEGLVRDGFRGPLDIAELARAAGVHPVHLARVWSTHHGCSLTDSVRRHRVDWVAERLATTDRTVADLAVEAGFADQSHLSRTFGKCTGLTPSAYRRLRRK